MKRIIRNQNNKLSILNYQFYKIDQFLFAPHSSFGIFVQYSILMSLLVNSCICFKDTKSSSSKNQQFSNSVQLECPVLNIEKRHITKIETSKSNLDQLNRSNNKILECNSNFDQIRNQTNYICKCKYASNVNSYLEEDANSTLSLKSQTSDCLLVYVGMAVKGYNLIYRQWISKENCLDLCLSTTRKNGYNFDCKSFEHWHGDCTSNETSSKVCASFSQNENGLSRRNHRHHNLKHSIRNKRAIPKLDYCVLSNQTIKSAGTDFAQNNAVTYYELLCQRSDENAKSQNKNKIQKPNVKPPDHRTTWSRLSKTTNINTSTQVNNSNRKAKNNNNNSSSLNSKCLFNPCANGGTCLLIDKNRFTCSCQKFFYGVYCENYAIKKICHKTYMELLIYQQIVNPFQIELSDLYINDRNNANYCRLKPLNQTHVRFQIPFEKCSTSQTSTKFENVYVNKLLSSKELTNKKEDESNLENNSENSERYLLAAFECRFDKSTYLIENDLHSSTKTNQINQQYHNEKITKSTTPCIIDLLNLKLKVFHDLNYRKEIMSDWESVTKLEKSSVAYTDQLFVQFSVYHSDKLDELYQIHDRLRYFHLTIEKCWLSLTQNENIHLVQVLIENGCQRERVSFDDLSLSKNSIRFSFYLANNIKQDRLSSVYLHCFPQICTDAPRTSKDHLFYSQFKSCQNISDSCRQETNSSTIANSEIDTNSAYSIRLSNKLNTCNNKFSIGPIHLSETTFNQLNHNIQDKQITTSNDAKRKDFNQFSNSSSRPCFSSNIQLILIILLMYQSILK